MAGETSTCYCGCGTQRNKVLWAVSGITGGIAVLCFIISLVLNASCNESLTTCGGSAAFFWIFILFLIACTIPCYMMCCCSAPPQNESNIAKAGVPLQSTYVQAPVMAPPVAHPGVPVQMPPQQAVPPGVQGYPEKPPPPPQAVVPGVQPQPMQPPPPPPPHM